MQYPFRGSRANFMLIHQKAINEKVLHERGFSKLKANRAKKLFQRLTRPPKYFNFVNQYSFLISIKYPLYKKTLFHDV